MMKRFAVFFLLLSLSDGLFSSEKVLTVYATTDIHAKLFQAKPLPDLRKLSAAIQADRNCSGGKERTLWIDSGDLLLGSPEGAMDRGRLVAETIGRAGLDVWVPGNHDFEFGLDALLRAANSFPLTLCGNLKIKGNAPFPAWKMISRNNLRIAVIGITSEHIASWNWKTEESGVRIEKTLPALDRILPEIMRAHPDFIILAIHAGRFQSKRFNPEWSMGTLAGRYPQIDLILGGHTHEFVSGIPFGKSWYVQGGKYAGGYIRIEAKFKNGKRLSLTSRSVLIPENTPAPVEPDPEFARELERMKKQLSAKICTRAPALGPKAGPKDLIRIFCESIARPVQAKIAFHGILSSANKYKPVYTNRDVFDLCPFENTVIRMQLSPSECRAILEEQKKVGAKSRMPQTCRGVTLRPDGQLVFPDGRVWSDEKERVTAVFNSFVASSAGMRFPVLKRIAYKKEVGAEDTGLLVRDLLRDHLERNYP